MREHITLVLPQDVLEEIDEVASLAGTSRSVVIQVHLIERFRPRPTAPPPRPLPPHNDPNLLPALSRITLPEAGFLRLSDIIGRTQGQSRKLLQPRLIPVAAATWWKGVKTGRFPQPVKLGGATVWRVEDIRALIQTVGAGAEEPVDPLPPPKRLSLRLPRA